MEKLVIVGIGTNSRLALSFIKYHNLFNVIGFAVNKDYYTCDTFEGYPVYVLEELEDKIGSKDEYSLFISLLWNNLNSDRRKLYEYCKNKGFKLANLISPLAIVRSEITGDNCWIQDQVVIQNDTKIGNNVAIMAGALIGADCNVASHCFFGAYSLLAGGCTLGEQSFIGLKATVFDDTKIGKKCIIGACTAVKRDMPDFSRYVTSSDNICIKQYDEDEIECKLMFKRNVRNTIAAGGVKHP